MKDNYDKLLEKAVRVLKDEMSQNEFPCYVTFDIPGSPDQGFLRVEKNYNTRGHYYLSAAGLRKGTDRLLSNYIYEGDFRAVEDYLGDSGKQAEIRNFLDRLCKKIDDYYDQGG